jgi:lipopolysaccharide transport system ATP-binding protein
MRPIITVRDLSKRYRLGTREAGYRTLREAIVNAAKGSLGTFGSRLSGAGRKRKAGSKNDLWALRDVGFDVAPGEVLGVVGRNGAGKSTLLKILSRITDPTTGQVKLYGRVGSLLEVGTGFHPELTGRENIFLSGAILGMRRMEIARKLDEIVTFAEIEKFIDTPVKRYSSGMFVRLAFAVAAHLEPEILLVDEVLAVGDLAFQKRCLGKMGDVARDGRTVLFVSHNMASIEALCGTCLFMSNGRLIAKGATNQIISHYMTAELRPESAFSSLTGHPGRRRDSIQMMTSVTLRDGDGTPAAAIRMGSSLSVSVSFTCDSNPITPVIGLVVKNAHGLAIFCANNKFIGGYRFEERVRLGTISCTIDGLPLLPGKHSLDLYLGDGPHDVDVVYDAISFEVQPADVFGTGHLPPPGYGLIYWPARFALANSSSTPTIDVGCGAGVRLRVPG